MADTFDALTTGRPYRTAVSVEEAVETLRGNAAANSIPTSTRSWTPSTTPAMARWSRRPRRVSIAQGGRGGSRRLPPPSRSPAGVAELADGCERGAYRGALSGSQALLARAVEFGASLLECHAFLERFGQVTTRLLARAGAEHAEIAGTRLLVTAIQQSLIGR